MRKEKIEADKALWMTPLAQMNTHLIAAIITASLSVANANSIPVNYVRMEGNTEYGKVFHGHENDKPTAGISAPFAGKLLSDVSPVQQITVWHDYPDQVTDEFVRQKLPQADFLWILKHHSMRPAREQDYINIPAGTEIDICYRNGFVLRVNTSEKTSYEGILISPTGKFEPVGFWLEATSK